MLIVWTPAELAVLRAAVASGVLTVHYSGPPARTVTYHSLVEMRALLAEMAASVEVAAGTRQAYRLAATSKGFE